MRYWIFYTVCIGSILILFLLHLIWGAVSIPISEVIQTLVGKESTHQTIILEIRLPRALASILAGMSLAVAGLLMQTFFQNPLAEPSVLGLSSGASLGVAVLKLSGLGLWGISAQSAWGAALFAMMGACLVLILMIAIATKIPSSYSLLLVGLMVGNFAYALISLLQHFSNPESVMDFWRWNMGSVAGVDWAQISVFCVVVIGVLCGAWFLSSHLNVWLLGEQYAASMGVSVGKMRLILILLVSLLSGVTTAFCGAISFIGLAVPIPVKSILRTSRHEILLPAVALVGAFLLLACDLLSKIPQQGAASLPLNVITALVGSPVVFWIILRSQSIYNK